MMMCKEIGVKLDKQHHYQNVTKSVKTSHERKVTILQKSVTAN